SVLKINSELKIIGSHKMEASLAKDELNTKNSTTTIISVKDTTLGRCQCNTQYYRNLTSCLVCYRANDIGNVQVANLSDFQSACKKLGITFTNAGPTLGSDSSAGTAKRVLIGVIIALVGIMLIGAAIWLYWHKSKSHPKLDSEPPPEMEHHHHNPPEPVPAADTNTEVVQPTGYNSGQPGQYFGGGVPPFDQHSQYYPNQPTSPPVQPSSYGVSPGTSTPPPSQHASYYSVSSSQPILRPSSVDSTTGGHYSQQYSSGQLGGIPEQEQTDYNMPIPVPAPVDYQQQYGYHPQGYPPQGYPPQGYPPQGYPPQGYPPQGYPPQGYPPQGDSQGYPPQGYPPQGDSQGYPPQDNPQGNPQGHPSQTYPHGHPQAPGMGETSKTAEARKRDGFSYAGITWKIRSRNIDK
ncbi:10449_t:CDS:2, partial [Scutellospora calospora]